MNGVKFTATKLANSNKQGILKPDENGYYEIIVGGLNITNSIGEYYTLKNAEKLFEESSIFMRRVKNGCLKGEVGHPKRDPNMRMDDYVNRILTIDEKNICCHFGSIWLDTSFGKNNPKFNNPTLTAIMAKVKPSGPKAASLETSLKNPEENVCFSIRALTNDYYVRGVNHRELTQIITWDLVNEPGLHIANKWDSPALESLGDYLLTERILENIINNKTEFVATEDTKELAIEALKTIKQYSNTDIKTPLFKDW